MWILLNGLVKEGISSFRRRRRRKRQTLTSSCVLWLMYGYLVGDRIVVVSNMVGLFFTSASCAIYQQECKDQV
jgi:hypothetical protein